MVTKTHVDEVLFDELADAGDIGIVVLLIEHRTAMAHGAASPSGTACSGREEQQRAAQLAGGKRSIIARQEPVIGRVAGDCGA